jgi:hypothetical protein
MRGVLKTFRDRAYDAVYRDGDFALQFVGDLIRGPSETSDQAFHKRQLARQTRRHGKALSYEERQAFLELSKRQDGEKPLDYWKRRKSLLENSNKKGMAQHYLALKSRKVKLDSFKVTNDVKTQKRLLEKQFREIQQAKYSAKQSQTR